MDDGTGEEPVDPSPWERDDWMPQARPPVEFHAAGTPRRTAGGPTGPAPGPGRPGTPGPDTAGASAVPAPGAAGDRMSRREREPEARPDGSRTPLMTSRAVVAATAVVVGLAALVVFVFTRPPGDDGDPRDADGSPTTSSAVPDTSPESSAPRTTTPRTTVVRTTVPRTIGVVVVDDPATAPPESTPPGTTPGAETPGGSDGGGGSGDSVVTSGDVVAVEPTIRELELGAVPQWTDWKLPLAGPLASVAPTEVVFIEGRTLHRLQLPSGVIKSLRLPAPMSFEGQLAVNGDTIALPSRGEVVIVRDDRPTVVYDVGGMALAVRARPGTDDFVVTIQPEDAMGEHRIVVLAPDGTVTPVTHARLARSWPGEWAFGPGGEPIVSDIGGMYLHDTTTGAAVRLDDGNLVGYGANHVLVERCDAQLLCTTHLVDVVTWTGQLVPSILDEFPYGRDVPRVSPPGTHLALGVYRASGTPDLVVYDVATGVQVEGAGGSDFYTWSASGDVWTSDGAGLFGLTADNDVLVFEAIDGRRGEIVGFGAVAQYAVQPLASGVQPDASAG